MFDLSYLYVKYLTNEVKACIHSVQTVFCGMFDLSYLYVKYLTNEVKACINSVCLSFC
jgi:hypothetical protein